MRILYIDIDSLRPDHLGCYGYNRPTSPNIDIVAQSGVRFENYYTSDSPCLPSRTALFSGCFGITTGVVNHGGTHSAPRAEGPGRGFQSRWTLDSLAERLRKAGLRTASISPFPHRHSAYHIWEGFHETIDTGGDGLERADIVFPVVKNWLRHNVARKDWFLHVNLWDPHTPYDVPREFGEPMRDYPPPGWLSQEIIDKHRRSYGSHDAVTPHGHNFTNNWFRGAKTIRDTADWKAWIDGYDTGIRHADHYVGKIIEELRQVGIHEETAIIISSDHGENQGELGVYGDHQTADEHTNRVPLIIRWPGLTDDRQGGCQSNLHYSVDFAATLVELVGGEIPAMWDGTSFAREVIGHGECGREFLVLSQGAWSCQRGVRWGDYLLLRTYHTGHKDLPALALFNLNNDPHEIHNLAGAEPQAVAEGLRLLEGWMTEHLIKSGQPDPLLQVIAEGGPLHARDQDLPSLTCLLRATNRSDHADWLDRNHGRPRECSAP